MLQNTGIVDVGSPWEAVKLVVVGEDKELAGAFRNTQISRWGREGGRWGETRRAVTYRMDQKQTEATCFAVADVSHLLRLDPAPIEVLVGVDVVPGLLRREALGDLGVVLEPGLSRVLVEAVALGGRISCALVGTALRLDPARVVVLAGAGDVPGRLGGEVLGPEGVSLVPGLSRVVPDVLALGVHAVRRALRLDPVPIEVLVGASVVPGLLRREAFGDLGVVLEPGLSRVVPDVVALGAGDVPGRLGGEVLGDLGLALCPRSGSRRPRRSSPRRSCVQTRAST